MTTIIDGTNGITLPNSLTINTPGVGTWSEFASGTAVLFQQTTAPTNWTKSTTHDNKALRVVSGSASSGGSVAFTTAFASQSVSGSVGNTTLTTTSMPSHTHSWVINRYDYSWDGNGGRDGVSAGTTTSGSDNLYNPTGSNGSDGAHNHSFSGTAINLAVQYVDAIICTKN